MTETKAADAPAPAPAPEPFTIEHNADGSAIVKLAHPVKVNGELQHRATIPPLTGRHMRKAHWSLHEGADLGDLIAFAAEVVEPAGIVDALPAWVAQKVAAHVMVCLGKSHPGGDITSFT